MSFAVAALALPGLAQDSKLNGTWKLNTAKSNFGQFPPPTSETDTLTVKGNEFKQESTSVTARGEQKGMRSCTVDGKEVTLTPDDTRVQLGAIKLSKMQCSWEGNAVVFLETASLNGSALTDKLTFSPSDDGKTMTMDSHITAAQPFSDRKLVYDKTDGSAAMADPPAGSEMAATPGAASMMHLGSAQPNFTGTWKLNVPKSNFGQIPPPASQDNTIEGQRPSVKIADRSKGRHDGRFEHRHHGRYDRKGNQESPGMGGAEVTSTAHWDGVALVVDSKVEFSGQRHEDQGHLHAQRRRKNAHGSRSR